MVTDQQVKRLLEMEKKEKTKAAAAAKAGMDEKSARKYIRLGKLPSQVKKPHTWRNRGDPFADIWDEAKGLLENNLGLEAKSLFEYFQRIYPGNFPDGQLRTFQRRVKRWRALEGPAKEVFFPQRHFPGELCESDFTWMRSMGVTIQNLPFDHLIFHFVLTYSNWETGTICFSESFESMSAGLQNALWELGGVPKKHRTDRLSAAVHKDCNPEEFTQRYRGLLRHYGITGEKIRGGEAHENGDVEQRHHRFKKALNQALILRGSRDFESREAYETFLRKLFIQLNAGRKERFNEEVRVLRRLPARRLDDFRWLEARVSPSGTIQVAKNTYSLHSRLKGETVRVKLYAEHFEVYYAQKKIDRILRLRGEGQHNIQYRHIIDSLVRKPGAFENYRYKEDIFPTIRFRMAYDSLCERRPARANKEYVKILYLAAKISESGVDKALHVLLEREEVITAEAVKDQLDSSNDLTPYRDVHIDPVNPGNYDVLLANSLGGEKAYEQ
jgi:hypothetical protein